MLVTEQVFRQDFVNISRFTSIHSTGEGYQTLSVYTMDTVQHSSLVTSSLLLPDVLYFSISSQPKNMN